MGDEASGASGPLGCANCCWFGECGGAIIVAAVVVAVVARTEVDVPTPPL
jgi:hypothetical protein